MANKEYIALICVDAANNKWRSYALQVAEKQVVCLWGRMNKYRRSLIKDFTTEAAKQKFLQSILLRRKRNGYCILEKSEGFPELKGLKDMPVTDNIAGQLRLF